MVYSNISPIEIIELSTGSEKSPDSIIEPNSDFYHQPWVDGLWFHEKYRAIEWF